MGLKDEFNNWPLGRQLQVIFVSSGLFLCLLLVIITKFQLDWLRNKVTNDSNSAVIDTALSQIKALGQVEGEYLESELRRYIVFAHSQKLVDQVFNDFNTPLYNTNPFKQDIAHVDTSAPSGNTYSYGVYFSAISPLDSSGKTLVNIESCFNYIYPYQLITEFDELYQGYETNELSVYFPAYTNTATSFTPLVREWYYKASDDKYSVVMTEPYLDSTSNNWIITASEAVLDNNNNLYGVVAVDINLKTLTAKTSKIVLLDTGFAMLVSAGGMILTIPGIWSKAVGSSTIRIFDSTYTGITQDQWSAIQNSTTDSVHMFNDVNNSVYYLVKHDINPFYNKDSATYYLLLCVPLTEMQVQKSHIEVSFQNTYVVLFWVTLSMGITVFLTITVLISIFSRKSGRQLKMIERLFGKVMRRALFSRITEGLDYKKLNANSKGIENLIEACKGRLNRIDDNEQSFSNYSWGLTRPSDYLQYNEWCDRMYPYNFYKDRAMPWRVFLPNLNSVL